MLTKIEESKDGKVWWWFNITIGQKKISTHDLTWQHANFPLS